LKAEDTKLEGEIDTNKGEFDNYSTTTQVGKAIDDKLVPYATTASVDTKLNDYMTSSGINTKFADYTTTVDLNT
jgi:hypothetical protein